jgi:hypothetical protein
MTDQTIFIIRHAEKPEGDEATGVDAAGGSDPRSLTPRGWQRAGAWAELFAPSLAQPSLPRPTAIFASAPAGHHELGGDNGGSKSRRPLETITPLASKLGITVALEFSKGSESELAQAISGVDGVVLVCWQHEAILDIAKALRPTPTGLPEAWPGDRFNVIFKFSRTDNTTVWTFQQIVPQMLDGDLTNLIS